VAAGLALAGSRLGGVLATGGDGALYRLALYSLTGWVGLHLLLTVLQGAGISWRLPPVLAALAAATAGGEIGRRWLLASGWPSFGDRIAPFGTAGAQPDAALAPLGARGAGAPSGGCLSGRLRSPCLGWGEGVALGALLIFTVGALSSWIANPDFVYHWGLKGQRFLLAGGVDYRYLGAGWNWVVHPDYPNLLPELFAVTALVAGRFDEPAMMLWSAVCFALLLAAAREALRRSVASRFVRQATLAGLAMALAAYGIGGLTAGGADWLIALALTAAVPPLLAPAGTRGAAQIGVIAALAAAAKVEGVALAAILIGTYAARLARLWASPRAAPPDRAAPLDEAAAPDRAAPPEPAAPPDTASPPDRAIPPKSGRLAAALCAAAALILPAAAVILPWLAAVRHYHLFQAFNSGPLAPERLPAVAAAIASSLHGSWWGFGYGLALLPLLALDRRLRALAAAVFLQLLFYLYVYLSVRIDAVALVAASFPRLVLHVLPALLIGAAIALERPAGGPGGGLSGLRVGGSAAAGA
jgi:hypothetical protein